MPSVTEIFRLLFGPPKERLDTNELPRWVEAHKINEKCVHRITLSRMVVSLSRKIKTCGLLIQLFLGDVLGQNHSFLFFRFLFLLLKTVA